MIVRMMRTILMSNLKTIHNVSPLRGVKTPKLLHNMNCLTIQPKNDIITINKLIQ